MRPILFLLASLLIASPASAAGWQSGMVEDEGGPVMQAWVEGEGGDVPPELRMMCGGEVNIRYGFGSGPGEGVEPAADPLTFTFDFGTQSVRLDMQHEEMDGMFAAYVAPDAPIISLLKSGTSVSIDDPTGTWHAQDFALAGSSAAIARVLASCS